MTEEKNKHKINKKYIEKTNIKCKQKRPNPPMKRQIESWNIS